MAMRPDENIMEVIWENIPKNPDEDHITLFEGDLEELWLNGFVDTDSYSLERWLKLFEPNKTPEDTYVMTKNDFLEKDKYRFKGKIYTPFEPLIINEGKYTDVGLDELIDLSIAPSCSLSHQELTNFFDKFKDKYRDSKDNLIVMDMKGKREIGKLLYENPSPTRRREILFEAMFSMQMEEIATGKSPRIEATPEQASQLQVSTFTTLPSCQAEEAARGLKDLEKSKKKTGATGSGDEGVKLKKVKKSRKGIKG